MQHSCTELRIEQAFKLRDSITRAFAWHDAAKLQVLLRSCMRFSPCTVTLAVTGIGRLICDKPIWSGVDSLSHKLLLALRIKWKNLSKTCPATSELLNKHKRSSQPSFMSRSFLAAVDSFQSWLLQSCLPPVEKHIARRVAIKFVMMGFTHHQHLRGVDDVSELQMGLEVADRALVARAVAVANANVQVATEASLPRPSSSISAEVLALSLRPEAIKAAELVWEKSLTDLGLQGLSTTLPLVLPFELCLRQRVLVRMFMLSFRREPSS